MRLSVTVPIQRPAAHVFAFLANFENSPRWQRGMQSSRWLTEAPVGVGSRYAQTARQLGHEFTSTFEVLEYEPGRRVKVASVDSTLPITVTRTVTPDGPARCQVEAVIEGAPTGVFRAASPMLRRKAQRAVRRDYKRLKRILERDRV